MGPSCSWNIIGEIERLLKGHGPSIFAELRKSRRQCHSTWVSSYNALDEELPGLWGLGLEVLLMRLFFRQNSFI